MNANPSLSPQSSATPTYRTVLGSLDHYEKGSVQIIDDDVKHYAFSNCFEVASKALPYERVVFGINQIYVLEVLRAEGTSPWFTCAHDEFVLCMDGEVDVHLIKLASHQRVADVDKNGAVLVDQEPEGPRMGRMRIRRGHQALLPGNTAYRFVAARTGVLIVQGCKGDLSVERWSENCQTTV
jgi:hypothetical protein